MEVGAERSLSGVSHSQLAIARVEDRNSANQLRRTHPGEQTLPVGRIRIRDSQDRGLHTSISGQPKAAGRDQLLLSARLDHLAEKSGYGDRSPGAAASGPRQHGLL